jgi:DNA-directed RNA polymerase specialized sigma24 family protein
MISIEQLYHEHHQPLRRYLVRLLDDPMTAEDVCHEAFVKALQHWDDCDEAASARGWLYRIAKNTAYDHLRRQRRAALNNLPEHYRMPLLLQLATGYPLHTIAATLGCNVNTIKTRLRRARLRFRQLYSASEEADVRVG